MKKLLTLVLVLAMVLGLGIVALAETYTDTSTATVTVKFTTSGGVSPAQTFTFSEFTPVGVRENPDATMPTTLPTITTVTFAEGAATADGAETGTATATITLPEYTAVGIYTYSFTQIKGSAAGVTYDEKTYYLVVTVIEQDGKVRVAAVHCEGATLTNNAVPAGTYGTAPKTDVITNTYENGTLTVAKTVTGNLGDQTKYFDVTVTFTAPTGTAINSTITYKGGKYTTDTTYDPANPVIQIKHGDTITFSNIPVDVTYTVVEKDYSANGTGDGYTTTYSGDSGTIAAGTSECTITNNKEVEVDTGVILDSLPYVLVALVAIVGVAILVIRKRRVED